MRSMVEGASKLPRQCRCRNHTAADAPPTALRAVPPPRYRGAGWKSRARMRRTNVSFCVIGERSDAVLQTAMRRW